MSIDLSLVFAYAVGLILLYIIGWLLVVPLKYLFKLLLNGIIGGAVLFVLNLLGKHIGFFININPITALITGFLGVPGIVLIFLLQKIL